MYIVILVGVVAFFYLVFFSMDKFEKKQLQPSLELYNIIKELDLIQLNPTFRLGYFLTEKYPLEFIRHTEHIHNYNIYKLLNNREVYLYYELDKQKFINSN